ncbi:hypothetical protein GGG16DRAFT_106910 [Schizophyllum commune]
MHTFDPNVISVSLSSYSHHATSTTSEASAVVLAPTTHLPRRPSQHQASSTSQTASSHPTWRARLARPSQRPPPQPIRPSLIAPDDAEVTTRAVSSAALPGSSTLTPTSAHSTVRAPSALSSLGDRGLVFNTAARTQRGASRPSLAMQNEACDSYQRRRRHTRAPSSSLPTRIRCPDPCELAVRANKKRLFASPTPRYAALRQLPGRMWTSFGIFPNPKPPEARAGFLGEISGGGGTSTPLSAFTRGQREVLRTHSSRKSKGLYFAIFVEPEPPEARAGSLGEGRGRASLAPDSTPDRQRHARAPSAKNAAGVGAPYHLVMNM